MAAARRCVQLLFRRSDLKKRNVRRLSTHSRKDEEEMRETVQRGLDQVLSYNSSSVIFGPLSLKYCDAYKNAPFSEAVVGYDDDFELDPNVDKPIIYMTCLDLFADSKAILTDFVNGKDLDLPESLKENVYSTVRCLHEFLNEAEQNSDGTAEKPNHAHCLRTAVTDESQVQFLLAEHLFSRLVPDRSYLLNRVGWRNNSSGIYCPCGICNRSMPPVPFAIGHTQAWHGHPDILVSSYNLPITVAIQRYVEDTDIDFLDARNGLGIGYLSCIDSELEAETKELHSPKVYQQVVATAIVNSFVHKKNFRLNDFFVPCFVSTQKEIGVYFYNCDSDILLRSNKLMLSKGGELRFDTIFCLWLCLNCFTYKPSLLAEEIQWLKRNGGGSNFHKLVGDRLQFYRNNLLLLLGDSMAASEDSRFETMTRKMIHNFPRSRLKDIVEQKET